MNLDPRNYFIVAVYLPFAVIFFVEIYGFLKKKLELRKKKKMNEEQALKSLLFYQELNEHRMSAQKV